MRILLVDDDENLMESLAERLIHQRYAVDIAVDGSSAATYVELFEYDLIVLDLVLPDGDGIAFCRAFRKSGYANPLMILTAKESTAQKVEALDAGADDYVVKPFDFDELCARIRALLRREHQGLPTVLCWGPLRLDPSACETTYKGQPVRLTPKEFSMMELFLRHPHRVYSLGAIIDDLWSFEDPPGEDAVRTHIKGLRRKLKQVGAPKDLIKTVYGLGYRLNEDTGWMQTTQHPITQGSTTQDFSTQDISTQCSTAQDANTANTQSSLTQALSDAYRRYLLVADEQIATLESVAAAAADCSLDAVLHAAGCTCAHKLVGALGSFGIAHASQIARNVEGQLRAMTLPLSPASDAKASSSGCDLFNQEQLNQWILELRDRIDKATAQSLTTAVESGLPNVMLVSRDAALVERLTDCAQQAELHLEPIATYQQATAQLKRSRFNLIMVDMSAVDEEAIADEAIASFITMLKQDYALPVVVLGTQFSLARRLMLIRQGVDLVSDRTLPPTQIIETITSTLQACSEQIQIAIADDDPEMLSLFQTSLKPWGFQIVTFTSAADLWQWLSDNSPSDSRTQHAVDVLVLDIEMPQISGLELCQILRADARFHSVPILFLTRHTEAALRTQAYQLGADDFIQKAVAPAELATRLNNQLTRACRL